MDWSYAVYQTVQTIPHGQVTTYGHVASLLGEPQRPRQVGTSLRYLPRGPRGRDPDYSDPEPDTTEDLPYHAYNVPWQRVVNSKGMISHRGPGSAARQAELLRAEGVVVDEVAGEFYISLHDYGWFPTPD